MDCITYGCVDNREGKCNNSTIKEKNINCCHRKTKTPTYAEEQLEHAQDKENRCYNKECQHIKDNQCYILKTENCSSVLKEPINYEKEYNKLKKENEEIETTLESIRKWNEELKYEIEEQKK